ncbi:acetate uptake transporter [Streptomyces sp. NPDC052107]|uniref:acetate uptake transporter n=1 Tax=Streptomyces sp. NPDC052107 TaxID=3155632 RepID=UPI0034429E7F
MSVRRGLAQFAASRFELRRGNTFGATAFCSYAASWLSSWRIAPRPAFAGDTHDAVGLFLLGWAIFTAFMAVGAFQGGAQPQAMTQPSRSSRAGRAAPPVRMPIDPGRRGRAPGPPRRCRRATLRTSVSWQSGSGRRTPGRDNPRHERRHG